MIKRVIRLKSPGFFQMHLDGVAIAQGDALIRPVYGSICKADLRYYLGARPQDVLIRKLPCALIHECCALVQWDPYGRYQGRWVVPVPNTPSEREQSGDGQVSSNYLEDTQFRSSGFDGYTQDTMAHRRSLLVECPPSPGGYMAYVFSEIISVCVHALSRAAVGMKQARNIGIWGDGVVGYTMGIVARALYPNVHITSIIKHETRRSYFQHATTVFSSGAIPNDCRYDVLIECVGGQNAQHALDEIIEHAYPGSCVLLTGVTESNVPIKTRTILEKGLTLIGSSRSTLENFHEGVSLLSNKWVADKMSQLVRDIVRIRDETDLDRAFQAAAGLAFGRIVLDLNF